MLSRIAYEGFHFSFFFCFNWLRKKEIHIHFSLYILCNFQHFFEFIMFFGSVSSGFMFMPIYPLLNHWICCRLFWFSAYCICGEGITIWDSLNSANLTIKAFPSQPLSVSFHVSWPYARIFYIKFTFVSCQHL